MFPLTESSIDENGKKNSETYWIEQRRSEMRKSLARHWENDVFVEFQVLPSSVHQHWPTTRHTKRLPRVEINTGRQASRCLRLLTANVCRHRSQASRTIGSEGMGERSETRLVELCRAAIQKVGCAIQIPHALQAIALLHQREGYAGKDQTAASRKTSLARARPSARWRDRCVIIPWMPTQFRAGVEAGQETAAEVSASENIHARVLICPYQSAACPSSGSLPRLADRAGTRQPQWPRVGTCSWCGNRLARPLRRPAFEKSPCKGQSSKSHFWLDGGPEASDVSEVFSAPTDCATMRTRQSAAYKGNPGRC